MEPSINLHVLELTDILSLYSFQQGHNMADPTEFNLKCIVYLSRKYICFVQLKTENQISNEVKTTKKLNFFLKRIQSTSWTLNMIIF